MRLLSAFLAILLAVSAKSKYIVPGGRWRDTDGNFINAHGAGITFDQKSGLFWWFGEHKTEEEPEGGGVSVYSSEDLSTWKSGGLALGNYPSPCWRSINNLTCTAPIKGHPYIAPGGVIQRPKVAYSPETEDYHVCMQISLNALCPEAN